MLIIVSIAVLLVLIISMIIIGKLFNAILIPLHQIKNATNALVKGDFSVNIS